jgi:hypothetical protein
LQRNHGENHSKSFKKFLRLLRILESFLGALKALGGALKALWRALKF